MRKIIVSMVVSLDGFYADPNGGIDWNIWDEEAFEYGNNLIKSVDTLLFGRVTYQMFENYWPAAATNPSSTKNEFEFSHFADNVQKIVISKTLKKVEWKNTKLIKNSIAEEILKLKKQPGKDILIYGSASIVSALMNLGLIDEYHLFVNPIVLGKGKPLFKDLKDIHKFKLLKTKTLKSGVVTLHYSKGSDVNEKDLDKNIAKSTITKNKGEPELVITRIFDAPRELVWKAWTEPEYAKRWWGPKTFTSPVAKIDLRVGGEYLNCMRSPDGKDFWSKGVFREIIPLERLVMTDSFADDKGNTVSGTYYGMGPDFPLELLITVTFEELDGKTKLTLKHSDISSVNATHRDNMEQGWRESFDKLADELAKESVKEIVCCS